MAGGLFGCARGGARPRTGCLLAECGFKTPNQPRRVEHARAPTSWGLRRRVWWLKEHIPSRSGLWRQIEPSQSPGINTMGAWVGVGRYPNRLAESRSTQARAEDHRCSGRGDRHHGPVAPELPCRDGPRRCRSCVPARQASAWLFCVMSIPRGVAPRRKVHLLVSIKLLAARIYPTGVVRTTYVAAWWAGAVAIRTCAFDFSAGYSSSKRRLLAE